MVLLLTGFFVAVAQAASAQTLPEVRTAVMRALPILQRSAANFVSQRACVSCHHNSLEVITLRMAQQHGFSVDAKVLDAVELRTFRELRNANAFDDAVQVANLSDPTPNDSYLLMAARAAGVRADLTTGVYARRIARWQREDVGYTPLMYAATLDQGDIETVKALLAAGADRSIRNDQGRTAFEQARRHKHMAIADALR